MIVWKRNMRRRMIAGYWQMHDGIASAAAQAVRIQHKSENGITEADSGAADTAQGGKNNADSMERIQGYTLAG